MTTNTYSHLWCMHTSLTKASNLLFCCSLCVEVVYWCRDSIETESKKTRHKNLFLLMNKNVFPLSKKQQKMKANFAEHEYNYVKAEEREARQWKDEKVLSFWKACDVQNQMISGDKRRNSFDMQCNNVAAYCASDFDKFPLNYFVYRRKREKKP